MSGIPGATNAPQSSAPVTVAQDDTKIKQDSTDKVSFVQKAWLRDGDGTMMKIVKIALCWISVPTAWVIDRFVAVCNWMTPKPEEETGEVEASVNPDDVIIDETEGDVVADPTTGSETPVVGTEPTTTAPNTAPTTNRFVQVLTNNPIASLVGGLGVGALATYIGIPFNGI